METFQTQKIDTDIKIKELMYKRESLRKQLSGEKQLAVAMVTTEGSPQARLNYLNSQLVVLMTKYTERYPEVLEDQGRNRRSETANSPGKDLPCRCGRY